MLPNCKTGLLILTSPINQLIQRISPILHHATSRILETLYIQLHPGVDLETEPFKPRPIPVTQDVCSTIIAIYAQSAQLHGYNISVLLDNTSSLGALPAPRTLNTEVGLVLTDCSAQNKLQALLNSWFVFPTNPTIEIIPELVLTNSDSAAPVDAEGRGVCLPVKSYGSVVLGGTFDHIHAGHKILLSESAIRAEEKITVGVTDISMLQRKTLPELIQPLDVRIASVREFIQDVKPRILHPDSVVPIGDAYGPSVVDPDMRCIVVSEETRKGGEAVNRVRREKGLCVLDVYEISLVEDINHAAHEEAKISSSTQRIRLLGTLLKQPRSKNLPGTPYVIGLTGGIASGKSSVCRRLEGLGAAVIDCDKLGHKAYLPGTRGYQRVVAEFGQDVVGDDGSINRRALGAKVFQDRSRLDRLNQIVWPEIASMAREEMRLLGDGGCLVCVLDAAVLIEAGWDRFSHEVWSCIVHKDEALKRILDRDRLQEEKARQRIDSQLSNQERVDHSNVVFCTFWEPDVTQKQVERAWEGLMERIPSRKDEQQQPKL